MIFQLAHLGSKLIYNNASGGMDFRSGIFPSGLPEVGKMSAGLIERGIYHGLPPLLLEADIIARAG